MDTQVITQIIGMLRGLGEGSKEVAIWYIVMNYGFYYLQGFFWGGVFIWVVKTCVNFFSKYESSTSQLIEIRAILFPDYSGDYSLFEHREVINKLIKFLQKQ